MPRTLTRRLHLESLEDRRTPAMIAWDGGPTGNGTDFLTAVNWVGDVLPATTDDVTIGSTGTNPAIVLSVNRTVNSLTSSRVLQIRGNSTTGDVTLNVTAGVTNTGTIELTSDANFGASLLVTGGTLTNASGATLRALPGSGGGRNVVLAYAVDFVNQGTVAASADTNINAGGGTSDVSNTGTFSVAAGRTLTVTGTFANYSGTTLTGGTYDVAGTFRFPNAAVNTLGANLILTGPASTVLNGSTNANALANLSLTAATGRLALTGGRNFTRASY